MPRKANTPPDPKRQLMIKTKTCQRLLKEVAYYKKEVEENEGKLKIMKDEERDPYDIKKFEEVLDESYMMIPDSKNRLDKSIEDLYTFVSSLDDDITVSNNNDDDYNEWYCKAQILLKEHHSSETKKQQSSDDEEESPQPTNVDDLKDGEVF